VGERHAAPALTRGRTGGPVSAGVTTRFVGERSVRAAMVWDWRLEEDGEVLDSSSARWSPTASISISASAVVERTESMAAGPGPTSWATEAS
jgi:hypothetical protein